MTPPCTLKPLPYRRKDRPSSCTCPVHQRNLRIRGQSTGDILSLPEQDRQIDAVIPCAIIRVSLPHTIRHGGGPPHPHAHTQLYRGLSVNVWEKDQPSVRAWHDV